MSVTVMNMLMLMINDVILLGQQGAVNKAEIKINGDNVKHYSEDGH
jgi:hypothetical protein